MNVAILGVPMDLGADRRGVDMGASAIRYAELADRLEELGHAVVDAGNIDVPVAESVDEQLDALKYLRPILAASGAAADAVDRLIADGYFPLTLGGDHTVSLGAVTGAARHRSLGLIWLDAHGDYNVPDTSPSGNIHGMVLAALTGRGDRRLVTFGGLDPAIRPENVALVGVRELDPGEGSLLASAGVVVFTMHDVDRLGMATVAERAIDRVMEGVDGLYVSLDLDVVDPAEAPGVGTPVLGGLTFRETHLAMEIASQSGKLVAMDAVEVNPVLDDHNRTARLAVQFILSALGKTIL